METFRRLDNPVDFGNVTTQERVDAWTKGELTTGSVSNIIPTFKVTPINDENVYAKLEPGFDVYVDAPLISGTYRCVGMHGTVDTTGSEEIEVIVNENA